MVAFRRGSGAEWEDIIPEMARMRYFLNVRANGSLLVDEAGSEFYDLSAACACAMRIALELARKYPRRSGSQPASMPLTLEVLDQSGALVFRTPVR
jgi:hypothetical protein